jgi:hypothetical protein
MTNTPETPELEENAENVEEESPRTPFEEFLYHQRRALEETGRALESLLPEGFRKHGSNASKEFARGFRALVDAAMQEVRKARKGEGEADGGEEETPPPSTTGKTKVKVEVE